MLTFKRFLLKFFTKFFLSSKKYVPGIYLVHKPLHIRRVLFYFNDPKRFHLGDHFFIEPLVRLMRDNNLDTAIIPLPQMEFYFALENISIPASFEPSDYDLIITRIEFYDLFKDSTGGLLILDTTDNKIDQPICNYFLTHVATLLKLNHSATSPKPFAPAVSHPIEGFDPLEHYLVFNNYLLSSRFLVTQSHRKLLCETAQKIAREHNLLVIHTGTAHEKENDPEVYDFVDLDLRGKLSVEALFALTASANVRMNISFDAFGMHLFLLYNKPSVILFRGRFLKRNRDYVLNCLNPPFRLSQKEQNHLITYIGNA